ncbi:hypothetical protein [Streptomyces sp. WMMC940]|uniref:hypothetical protein n=1 Tax=Streptomyces sp. WMMC940 TaxID=3015153 RepID=UPI0022B6ED05|nr:hypothetical protein [Streptomyces sp. WMMC940]MCZ7456555.1 hypothetical protein [Streptomyces sp. WMMC940]
MKRTQRQDEPRTAEDEVEREVREAAADVTDGGRGRGGAGDALTPNEAAQEEAHGDRPDR